MNSTVGICAATSVWASTRRRRTSPFRPTRWRRASPAARSTLRRPTGFNNPTISASGIFDLGFGYQFNSWFRADFTEEYRGGSSFQSLEVLNEPNIVGGNTSIQQYADFYRANISSWVSLFNGYVDLGTWSGITPYVGAGVGFAYNTLSGFTDTGYAYTNGVNSASGGYFNDAGKWNFAWALMAGLSFDVTQNLKLDLGYRYLDYGKFTSGTVNCLGKPRPGFTTSCYSSIRRTTSPPTTSASACAG